MPQSHGGCAAAHLWPFPGPRPPRRHWLSKLGLPACRLADVERRGPAGARCSHHQAAREAGAVRRQAQDGPTKTRGGPPRGGPAPRGRAPPGGVPTRRPPGGAVTAAGRWSGLLAAAEARHLGGVLCRDGAAQPASHAEGARPGPCLSRLRRRSASLAATRFVRC